MEINWIFFSIGRIIKQVNFAKFDFLSDNECIIIHNKGDHLAIVLNWLAALKLTVR